MEQTLKLIEVDEGTLGALKAGQDVRIRVHVAGILYEPIQVRCLEETVAAVPFYVGNYDYDSTSGDVTFGDVCLRISQQKQ